MKEADQSSAGNKDGYISRDELNLYSPPDKYRSVSVKASLVLQEWENQSAKKTEGTQETSDQNIHDIVRRGEQFIKERASERVKKDEELNKFANNFADATENEEINLTSSATDSRGYVNANGQIGEYKFKYTNLNSDTSPAKLTLTDSSGKKVELENPEKYKELEPFLKKLESAVKNNPDNEHIVVRYSCQFSSRFQ
jgi:hypothetical protein